MNLKYLLASTFGLFLGIIFTYKLNFSTLIFIVSLVIILINFIIYKFKKPKNNKNKNETTIFIIFLFIFINLGIVLGQYNLAKTFSQKQDFQKYISNNKTLSGKILNINYTEKSQQLIVKLDTGSNKSFRVKLVTNKIIDYKLGENLSFSGKLSDTNVLLPDITDTVSQSYNIENKDDLENISGEFIFPNIKITTTTNNIFFNLKNLKNTFVKILDKVSPRSLAALSSGVTLGDQSLFTQEEISNFQNASLSHIMVLSGFNITVLILFFSMLFLTLNIKLKYRVALSILIIIIFILIVGAGPSILRAGIMGSMLLIASIFGKPYLAKQGLFISAIIMLILNPKIAPYDISFHLSFLATLGILYISPILENYNFFKPKLGQNRFLKNIIEIFRITLAIQIIITPYLAFVFGEFSLLGIFANILVIPIIPILMALTILIIIFYFIFSPISIFISYVAYIFSKYIYIVAEYFSNSKLSQINSYISIYTFILIYLLLIFFIYFEDKRLRIQKYLKES